MCKTEKSFTEFGGKKDGWLDLEGNRHKWHCRACDYKYIQELNKYPDLILRNYELMDLLTHCDEAIGFCYGLEELERRLQ